MYLRNKSSPTQKHMRVSDFEPHMIQVTIWATGYMIARLSALTEFLLCKVSANDR